MIPVFKPAEDDAAEKARLLDLSNDAILVRDASDRITFWNRGATEMYGFTREESVGRVSHELLKTEFSEPFEGIREQLLRDGNWAGDLRHTCADGSQITVSTRWVADRDALGRITAVLESNRDISGLMRAQEVQSRLATIVETSDDAIVSKDLNGVITSWNKAAERIFGYRQEEAIGRNITLIIPPDRLGEESEILKRIRAGERIEHFETLRRRKDGTLLEISVTVSPIKDALGRVVGASKVARDVTERKRMERVVSEAALYARLLQLQEEERRRMARELHDGIGQLLVAMSMSVGSMAGEASGLGKNVVRSLKETASLIEQAISEIRTISHLLHPPLLDEVGLTSALRQYVLGFGERSKLQVTLELPDDSVRMPREVELSLFRIVQECLTNIHRHSGSRTARVRLSYSSGEIYLEVSDQGRGLSPDVREKFATGTTLGVGLSGMRERVRQIGGTLRIESDANGTSVIAVIPESGK